MDIKWSGSGKSIRQEAYTLGHRHGAETLFQNQKNAGKGYPMDSLPDWLADKHEREHRMLAKKAEKWDQSETFYANYALGEQAGRAGLPNSYGIASPIRRRDKNVIQGEVISASNDR